MVYGWIYKNLTTTTISFFFFYCFLFVCKIEVICDRRKVNIQRFIWFCLFDNHSLILFLIKDDFYPLSSMSIYNKVFEKNKTNLKISFKSKFQFRFNEKMLFRYVNVRGYELFGSFQNKIVIRLNDLIKDVYFFRSLQKWSYQMTEG